MEYNSSIEPIENSQKEEEQIVKNTTSQILLLATKEFDVVPTKENHEMLVMATLKAPIYEPKVRAPLNIMAVIDRSGSMEGEKLKLVKQTLKFMISQLKAEDYFGLVTFESQVQTVFKMTAMNDDGKEMAQMKIKQLKTDGNTNLSGGLDMGLTLMKEHAKESNQIYSVMLMTDGLANSGVTEKPAITNIVKNHLENLGNPCTMFTFGFGGDHDDNLLKMISEAGKGIYYYVENEEKIPPAFADCLGGLISVVGQNIKLKLEFPEGIKFQKLLGKKFKATEISAEPSTYEIMLGDIYSEEERNILISLEIASTTNHQQRTTLSKLEVSYLNVITSKVENSTTVVYVDRDENAEMNSKASNSLVDKNRNRLLAADALEEANALGAQHKLDDARKLLREAIDKISNSVTGQTIVCKDLCLDLQEALAGLKDRDTYAYSGSKAMSSKSMSHYYERSTHSTRGYYDTSSKMAMRSQMEDVDDED